MRIAFYAPMKAPDHPVPSGDRQMARLLIRALSLAGHEVELAARLRSRDPKGDPQRQARLQRLGGRLAGRYLARRRPPPDLWFTYHLYYKAPDWIGPQVATTLGIPYVVAEASVAPKRAGGPWDLSHRAVLAALDRAAAIIPLNPRNRPCLPHPERIRDLAPFTDLTPLQAATANRAAFASLDPRQPWIVTAAMMRHDVKLDSYRILAAALGRLTTRPWQLLLIGDGPARAEVQAAFATLPLDRVCFTGRLEAPALADALASADIYAWPAVREAYGMAMLEAAALGLPVVAGDDGGVSAIVTAAQTGLLAAPGDPDAFAAALAQLLDDPEARGRLGAAGRAKAEREHSLDGAARRLDAILREAAA